MDPATLAALITAAGSIGGGLLGRQKTPRETPIQKRQRFAIDDIFAGLKGEGPYANLFQADEDAFQRSYVDPAMERWNTFIRPAIAQSHAGSGLSRSTGFDDELTRAGVNMSSLLNEQYAAFQNQAMQRAMQGLTGALGASPGLGPQSQQSPFGSAVAGYLTSPAFGQGIGNILQGDEERTPYNPLPGGMQPYEFNYDYRSAQNMRRGHAP